MYERCGVNNCDNEILSVSLGGKENTKVHMTGQITDRIFKDGELVETREGRNLVVNSFLNLIMCLLKNPDNYRGIQYWAVGSGNSSWDTTIPSPEVTATKLTLETGRVPIPDTGIVFLDSSFNESSTPTNILQITCLFGEYDCNGVWREFALFGGDATDVKDSGIMINKRHHEVLTKTSDMTVERVMRFTLNLV